MANYASANAGLDALAQARRARGQHAVSIQWGPWEGTGMLAGAVPAISLEELRREGVGSLSPAQGAELFAALAGGDPALVTVLPVDWATFTARSQRRRSPFFRAVVSADQRGPEPAELLALLDATPEADRRELLTRLVRDAVALVLRLRSDDIDADRPLGSLGLDSLMAVELRNRLADALDRPLSVSWMWNYPTVAALSGRLAELLDAEAARPCGSRPGGPDATGATDADGSIEETGRVPEPDVDAGLSQLLSRLDGLSDDDLRRLIDLLDPGSDSESPTD